MRKGGARQQGLAVAIKEQRAADQIQAAAERAEATKLAMKKAEFVRPK